MEQLSYIFIGGIILLIFFLSGFKIVKEGTRGIVDSNGKFKKFILPGKVYIPFTQKLHTFDISEKTIKISHPVTTKDNITLHIEANVTYQISNLEESVKKLFYELKGYEKTIEDHIKSELADAFTVYTLKELPTKKIRIVASVRNNSIALSKYYTITDVEFTKIVYPAEIQESINKIIVSANEKEAAKKLIEAEKIKNEGLKKIQEEQAEANAQKIRFEADTKRRAIESVTKAEKEALDLLEQEIEQKLKTVQDSAKKIFDERKEMGVRRIKGND